MTADLKIVDACRRQRVNEAFLELPDDIRRVFIARNADGMNLAETCQATGLSPQMVAELYRAAVVPLNIIAGADLPGAMDA